MNNRNMRLLERRAILSKTSLEIFGNNLFNNVIALEGDMDNFAATIHEAHQELMQKIHELPCILVNSQTSDQGTLLNPTTIKQHGYPLPLTEPNPRNREELLNFTVSQCIASAESLGLPSLPQDTPVQERRGQIAGRLGVFLIKPTAYVSTP